MLRRWKQRRITVTHTHTDTQSVDRLRCFDDGSTVVSRHINTDINTVSVDMYNCIVMECSNNTALRQCKPLPGLTMPCITVPNS